MVGFVFLGVTQAGNGGKPFGHGLVRLGLGLRPRRLGGGGGGFRVLGFYGF